MDEVRKNNPVKIKTNDEKIIEGVVIDYLTDRIMITVRNQSIEDAKVLKDLDTVEVTIYTPLGIKTMESHVISALNQNSCIVVENVPTAQIAQRRAFVRVSHSFDFDIIMPKSIRTTCKCINLSAGGIAFRCDRELLKDDTITIFFPAELFERDIVCKAKIVNAHANGRFTAKYTEIKSYDEDKIVKFVFKVMTRNAH